MYYYSSLLLPGSSGLQNLDSIKPSAKPLVGTNQQTLPRSDSQLSKITLAGHRGPTEFLAFQEIGEDRLSTTQFKAVNQNFESLG